MLRPKQLRGDSVLVWDFGQGKDEKEEDRSVQASNVDHDIVSREVIQNVTERLIAKGEKARESHDETGDHRYSRAVMCYLGEAVHGWFLERAVNQKAVVVCATCC